jgi:hypothetical protein
VTLLHLVAIGAEPAQPLAVSEPLRTLDPITRKEVVMMMAMIPSNHGKAWSQADVENLSKLAAGNTPTRVIGLKTGRTPAAVQSKASSKGISLKPTNQSPYGTKK